MADKTEKAELGSNDIADSYELDINSVMSVLSNKTSAIQAAIKKPGDETLASQIKTEKLNYQPPKRLIYKTKPISFNDDESFNKDLMAKLAERQKAFISKAKSLDKPVIDTPSSASGVNEEVDLATLLKRNQTEAQLMVNKLKEKQANFVRAVLDE